MTTSHRIFLALLLGGALSAQTPHPAMAGLDWSTFLGSPGAEACRAVVVDAAGEVFVAGDTDGAAFPTTAGAFDRTHNGGRDVFVARLDGSGRRLVWATLLGGSGDDRLGGLALTEDGGVLVTGTTASADFPTTPGAFDRTPNGGRDAFVVQLDAAGASLVFATLVGGAADDEPHGVARARDGDVVVAGTTRSADWPTTAGALQTVSGGGADGFVTRVTADGAALRWSSYFGAASDDTIAALALDFEDRAWIGGETASAGLPTTADAIDAMLDGSSDGFVASFSSDGATLHAASFVGGGAGDAVAAIVVSADGTVVAGGVTSSSDFATTEDAHDATLNGSTDGFVVRVDDTLTTLYAATLVGGGAADAVTALAPSRSSAVVAIGTTASSDFPTTAGGFDQVAGGGADGFVAAFDWEAKQLDYGSYLGDSADDGPAAAAADGPRALIVVGTTTSSGFPTTFGAWDTTYDGQGDGFASHLDTGLATDLATPFGPGTAGLAGRVPSVASNSDAFSRNRDFGVVVRGANPGAQGLVFLGLDRLSPPFLLLGFDLNVDPTTLILGAPLQIDGAGYGVRILPLPRIDVALFGSKLVTQVVVQDAAAPQGWSATRGLELAVRAAPGAGSAIPGSFGLFFLTLADKSSAATQAFLTTWQARGLRVHYDSTVAPYLHVLVPAAVEQEFATEARAQLALESIGGDVWLESDGPGEQGFPNDPEYANQWGVPRAGGPLFFGPTLPRVAVIDTGVFTQHEDLTGIVAHAFDARDNDNDTTPPDTTDANQHGTMVCGALAAGVDNGKGVTGMVTQPPWQAPTTWVRSYRDGIGRTPGLRSFHDVLDAIRTGGGIDIVNFSAHFAGGDRDLVRQTRALIDLLVANGVVFCVASGNRSADGPGLAVRWPAVLPSTLAVGASVRIDDDNVLDQRAEFSCFGRSLALNAPGADLVLPVWNGDPATSNYISGINGTSFATPMVTATLAAIWSHTRPAQAGRRELVESLLLTHAVRDVGDRQNRRGVLDVSGELILSKQNGLVGASQLRFPIQPVPDRIDLAAGRPMQAVEISPDRSTLVYSDGVHLWLIDRPREGHDPGPERNLTANDPVAGLRDSPVFTPDGEKILFTVRDDQNQTLIRWVNRAGTQFGGVTFVGDFPDHLHVSPDGTRVLFVDVRVGIVSALIATGARRVELPAMLDGSTVLTTYGHPRYSPDGTRIAAYQVDFSTNSGCFTNFIRQSTALITVVPGGGNPAQLVAAPGTATLCRHTSSDLFAGAAIWCPTWSPNGRYLYYLYSTSVPGLDEIRVHDFRTQQVNVVQSVPSSGLTPTWNRQRLVSSRW